MSRDSETTTRAEADKWATFSLHGEVFALRVEDVQEVMMYQALTPVPLAPDHVVGLLNLRGQIMAAVDLRRRLGFPTRGVQQPSSMLLLKRNGVLISLVVDDIGDVLEIPTADWLEPPDTLHGGHRTFILGICPIDTHVVLGLNVEGLIGDDERPTQTPRNN